MSFLFYMMDDLRCFFLFFRGGGVWFSSRWLFGTQLVVTQSGLRPRTSAATIGGWSAAAWVVLATKPITTTAASGGGWFLSLN